MEKKIYLIRHCQAVGQPPESQLTAEGMKQADRLADFLSSFKVDRIISSPFLRAVETIMPFAQKATIEIETDERLAERVLSSSSMPDWLEKLKLTFNDLDLKYEGGESSKEAMDRIIQAVNEMIESHAQNSVLVTHGNIMSLLLKSYNKSFGFDEWLQLSNPDVYCLQFKNDEVHCERIWRVLKSEEAEF
ncbi:histidine phosphatase family protein [Cytobacillus praedii]|uniref:Histidine phosphatase family protein n=1 Tax=Cytobacillus praedii TaxID=1742358 RepID=A0A4R1AVG7_9BACI|nr:histidine phosphatase family protein [Cytobacillus praedii]TCJ04365.1 histidine phosphatase family protein [Cytobacillus praedii]